MPLVAFLAMVEFGLPCQVALALMPLPSSLQINLQPVVVCVVSSGIGDVVSFDAVSQKKACGIGGLLWCHIPKKTINRWCWWWCWWRCFWAVFWGLPFPAALVTLSPSTPRSPQKIDLWGCYPLMSCPPQKNNQPAAVGICSAFPVGLLRCRILAFYAMSPKNQPVALLMLALLFQQLMTFLLALMPCPPKKQSTKGVSGLWQHIPKETNQPVVLVIWFHISVAFFNATSLQK